LLAEEDCFFRLKKDILLDLRPRRDEMAADWVSSSRIRAKRAISGGPGEHGGRRATLAGPAWSLVKPRCDGRFNVKPSWPPLRPQRSSSPYTSRLMADISTCFTHNVSYFRLCFSLLCILCNSRYLCQPGAQSYLGTCDNDATVS
jgi:hypothetical protein